MLSVLIRDVADIIKAIVVLRKSGSTLLRCNICEPGVRVVEGGLAYSEVFDCQRTKLKHYDLVGGAHPTWL